MVNTLTAIIFGVLFGYIYERRENLLPIAAVHWWVNLSCLLTQLAGAFVLIALHEVPIL